MIRERMLAAAASNTAIQAQGGHADALQWAAIWADLGLPKIFWVENLPVTFASLTYNPEGLDLPLIPAGVRKSDAGHALMSLDMFFWLLRHTEGFEIRRLLAGQ